MFSSFDTQTFSSWHKYKRNAAKLKNSLKERVSETSIEKPKVPKILLYLNKYTINNVSLELTSNAMDVYKI